MTQETENTLRTTLAAFQLLDWHVESDTGRLRRGEQESTLEPKLMDLLVFFANRPNQVLSRDEIERALWAGLVVGEDTVARAVSRLRRTLGDSVQSPRFIETLPKRGYRLIAPVTISAAGDKGLSRAKHWRTLVGLAVAATLMAGAALWFTRGDGANGEVTADVQQVARANDLYMRFTRADNEAAIGLYEQVLAQSPSHTDAQAGLANALVQRVVRWPRHAGRQMQGASSLQDALNDGLTQGPEAVAVLARAVAMAERAVRMAPQNPDALKALAFSITAQGDLGRAKILYREVIALDSDAWAAHINLGEIASMENDPGAAILQFEKAWAAMSRAYDYEPQRVGPWQVALGVVIGERYEQVGQPIDAELWYRRVLAQAPYEPEATVRLAQLLANGGDVLEASALCRALTDRLGTYPGCLMAN